MRKYLFIGLAVAAVGTAGYFGYKALTKKADDLSDEEESADEKALPAAAANPAPATTANTRNDNFPLKKGSYGARVKALQEALLTKAKAQNLTVLSKFGADSDFGSETVKALTDLKLSTTIDEATYNSIVGNSSSTTSTSSSSASSILSPFTAITTVANATQQFKDDAGLAVAIRAALTAKNYTLTSALLKQITSAAKYKKVSDIFYYTLFNGVRSTLLTATLNQFPDAKQHAALEEQFKSMGLIKNSATGKWELPASLKGLGDIREVITNKTTWVWKKGQQPIRVEAGIVLGRLLRTNGNVSLFQTIDNHLLYVQSSTIDFL